MIQLKNITKQYGDITALNHINLYFSQGEVIVLKGASGSGKSTILSLIAGLCKPTSGEAIVEGKQISKLNDTAASLYRRETIGFIFQKYNLIPNLTVKENIALPLIPNNPDPKALDSLLEITMKKFNISHKKENLIKNLSGGEQQRVAIARAYINNPKIIIADEPTANLDEKLSLHFIEILRTLKEADKTIIIATHDPLFFGLDFVDKIVEIHNGTIVV